MAVGTVTVTAGVGGMSVTRAASLTADGLTLRDPSVAAAKAGSLTLRTNDTDGTVTTTDSGAFTTADVIDLYWSGGRRYGVVVGTVSGTSVPISGGAGDNLPVADTAVTAMVPGAEDFTVGYAGLQALVAKCDTTGLATFLASGGSVVRGADLAGPNGGYVGGGGGGATNPFGTTNVTDVRLSHASSTQAYTVSAAALVN